MSYQKIIIVGNVGNDPEMRFTPSGKAVVSFSVATNRQYKATGGEPVKETTWFRVTAWDKTAEICNAYLKKGSQVLVEGRLTSDPNSGGPKIFQRSDGSSGANYEITAEAVKFLSKAAQKSDTAQAEQDDPGF